MKYTDQHHIRVGASDGHVRFSEDEITAAIDEMQRTRQTISSIERDGFFVGLTQNKFGTQFASAYAPGGFWVGLLSIAANGSGVVEINAPDPTVLAAGTSFHEMAAAIAGQESVLRAGEADDDSPGVADHDADIGDLRDDITRAGLANVKKVGLHLTDRTLEILSAGGSASARANAIAARYQAILDNPADFELIESIVEIERAERRWAAESKDAV